MDNFNIWFGDLLLGFTWFLLLLGTYTHYIHIKRGYDNYRFFMVYFVGLIIYTILLVIFFIIRNN